MKNVLEQLEEIAAEDDPGLEPVRVFAKPRVVPDSFRQAVLVAFGGRARGKTMSLKRDEGTRETMPSHLWVDAVQTAAIAKLGPSLKGLGYVGDWLRSDAIRVRTGKAYQAGEPVWMFVDELVLRARETAKANLGDGEVSAMRRIARESR